MTDPKSEPYKTISETLLWIDHMVESEYIARKQFSCALAENEVWKKYYIIFDAYIILLNRYRNFSLLATAQGEIEEDFYQSVVLANGGYYKAAMMILRSHFEVYIAHAKAIHSNQPNASFERNREQPGRHFDYKGIYDRESSEGKELNDLYGFLSNHIHSSGRKNSHSSYSSLPLPEYNARSLNTFYTTLHRVIVCNSRIYFKLASSESIMAAEAKYVSSLVQAHERKALDILKQLVEISV